MATNTTTAIFRNQKRAMQMVLQMLTNSGQQTWNTDGSMAISKPPRVWECNDADPEIAAAQYADYIGVRKGDWFIRQDSGVIESLWIVTVAPASGVAMTVVEVIA